jgi:CubicO group peptidase (beta-lactamase class C family)
LEHISGKTIVRIFKEDLLEHLDIQDVDIYSLGGGFQISSGDLGKLAQLMLNKGTYGNKLFMNEKTFNKMLPIQVRDIYPGIEQKTKFLSGDSLYGIGCQNMKTRHKKFIPGSLKEKPKWFHNTTIGHGSASSSILHVDLDDDVVIVQVRNERGKHFNKYIMQLHEIVYDNLLQEQ